MLLLIYVFSGSQEQKDEIQWQKKVTVKPTTSYL